MSHYIITIGREFGSCGREIGKILATELGIGFYDRELIEMAAEKSNMKASVLEDYDETVSLKAAGFFPGTGFKAASLQDKLFSLQAQIIKEVSSKESCVIIGRCADYVLRDHKNCLNVFVFAPYGVRYNRLLEEYSLTHEATERMIEQIDKSRHNYYKHYTKCDRGERCGKHIIIDSSVLGVRGTAKILKEIVMEKFR